jgi:hypothetical protein
MQAVMMSGMAVAIADMGIISTAIEMSALYQQKIALHYCRTMLIYVAD